MGCEGSIPVPLTAYKTLQTMSGLLAFLPEAREEGLATVRCSFSSKEAWWISAISRSKQGKYLIIPDEGQEHLVGCQ